MKTIKLECPNCGAPFDPPNNKNVCFCSSCGTKMMIDDGQIYININQKIENVTRTIDEAKIEREVQKTKRAKEWQDIVLIIGSLLFMVLILLASKNL